MKQWIDLRGRLIPALLLALALLLSGCGQPEALPVRIGVYDSRAVAVGWVGSKPFNDWMGALQSEWQKAKDAGDKKRVDELEAEAEARQQLMHMQAFSTASVNDILAYIEDSLPQIQQNVGVTMLVSKWDAETLAKYPSAEQVDVTMMLVDAFDPLELPRQRAIDIQKQQPISLEDAEKIED